MARTAILPFLPGLVLSLHMLVQGVWGHRVAAVTAGGTAARRWWSYTLPVWSC